jgi:REP element-mobilizing transposase RayT
MAKPLKKHQQQSFEFRTHGGKRKNAGRPPKGERSSEPHKERDDIDPRHPLLVTSRVVEGLGSLRRKDTFRALRTATLTVFALRGFHIVYASLQSNHLHLIVEAANKDLLAHGMKILLGSAAKHINRALGHRAGKRRTGTVFSDRYHANPLRSPRQVRNAVAYVLNNWRRHDEDLRPFAQAWKVDPFSNAVASSGGRNASMCRRSTRRPPPISRSLPGYRRRGCFASAGFVIR